MINNMLEIRGGVIVIVPTTLNGSLAGVLKV